MVYRSLSPSFCGITLLRNKYDYYPCNTTCANPISPSPGPVVLSSSAQLVAPVLVARGTLSITTSEIYFEVDEDDPAFKRVDPKVGNRQLAGGLVSCILLLFLHRKQQSYTGLIVCMFCICYFILQKEIRARVCVCVNCIYWLACLG